MREARSKKMECVQYLGYCVKEGYIDQQDAEEMIALEQWEEVYTLMGRGEAYADQILKGE